MRLLMTFAILFLCGTTAIFLVLQHKEQAIQTYNHLRLFLLDGKGPKCLIELEKIGAKFQPIGNQGTKECPVLNAVKLTQISHISLFSSLILVVLLQSNFHNGPIKQKPKIFLILAHSIA